MITLCGMKFNESLLELESEDSFYKATNIIKEYKSNHPELKILSLGIGDVSFPIPNHVAEKMIEATKTENSDSYIGYGNYYGIPELRKAIRDNEYKGFEIEEIYVGQGTKSDCGDILELFNNNILVGIPSPTYPIYENTCKSLNKKFEIISCDDSFSPIVPSKHYDVIYLCSPNNPVGVTYSYESLKQWVDYANKEGAVIIYDNVYYKFISTGIKSIYEIEGARKCSIELRSFSKHVSFTGIRCSYYVIPNDLHSDINKYWRLRTISRFNGASYIAQIGALASFDKESQDDINFRINYYKENAALLLNAFIHLGFEVNGGFNAPYLWIKCKNNLTGWDMFHKYLNEIQVVVVPGSIFGTAGKNYFRISALGKREDVLEAIERIVCYEQKAK